MTMGDILLGLLIVTGFFVSAAVSRLFRRGMTGIIIGGVAGLAVSVAMLFYGMEQLFPTAPDMVNETSN
ncbi:hypothetical protein [Loktanella sp. Alg231-35]|uniref:hypothetical protein n=1 Tax=Loktanella sp. Alg231-35 TaxID=1922220 RepID=UPI000D55455A|nr:hypothetical protein [Loktanella sp. Alg231-35]